MVVVDHVVAISGGHSGCEYLVFAHVLVFVLPVCLLAGLLILVLFGEDDAVLSRQHSGLRCPGLFELRVYHSFAAIFAGDSVGFLRQGEGDIAVLGGHFQLLEQQTFILCDLGHSALV